MHKKTSGGVEIGVLRGLELEQYFYFHSLCSLQGCPFQLEVFTKQSDHEVSAVDVSGVSKELEQALHESISMISKKTLIKNKKDLILHVAEFDQRISLAIENQVNNLFLLYYRKFDSLFEDLENISNGDISWQVKVVVKYFVKN